MVQLSLVVMKMAPSQGSSFLSRRFAGGVWRRVFFFDSVIYIPLHGARWAMAAASLEEGRAIRDLLKGSQEAECKPGPRNRGGGPQTT